MRNDAAATADMVSDRCQVAVIGGGPAGCAAAHVVGRLGLSTMVFERGGPYRDKACGDMFVASAVMKLREFGVDVHDLAAKDEARICSEIDFQRSHQSLWKVPFESDAVVVVSRQIVDQHLRDALPPSVRVLYSTPVVGVKRTDGGVLEVRARTSDGRNIAATCDAVILACGARHRLASLWGVSGSGYDAAAVSAYADHANFGVPIFDFSDACQPGYRWVFPSPGGRINAGICVLARPGDVPLKRLGDDLLRDFGVAGNRGAWRGGVAGLWSGLGTTWHNDAGVVSCGDAAALVDPTNAEGLTAALISGQAAGDAIASFLSCDRRASSLHRYSDWVRSTFSAKYAPTLVRAMWMRLCGAAP